MGKSAMKGEKSANPAGEEALAVVVVHVRSYIDSHSYE